jgi:hypothetical protein
MIYGNEPSQTFDDMLDSAFSRLEDTQTRFSIGRLTEMDERLLAIEKELDDFIAAGRALKRGD